jgi:hypothetical protein
MSADSIWARHGQTQPQKASARGRWLSRVLFVMAFIAIALIYYSGYIDKDWLNRIGIILNFCAGFMLAPELLGTERLRNAEGYIENVFTVANELGQSIAANSIGLIIILGVGTLFAVITAIPVAIIYFTIHDLVYCMMPVLIAILTYSTYRTIASYKRESGKLFLPAMISFLLGSSLIVIIIIMALALAAILIAPTIPRVAQRASGRGQRPQAEIGR